MSAILGVLLRFGASALKNRLVQQVLIALVLILISFREGSHQCEEKHARKAAQDAQEWQEKTTDAERRAYERGLQAARKSARNDKSVEEIVRDAGMEIGADDACLSGDIVKRLRNLQ